MDEVFNNWDKTSSWPKDKSKNLMSNNENLKMKNHYKYYYHLLDLPFRGGFHIKSRVVIDRNNYKIILYDPR